MYFSCDLLAVNSHQALSGNLDLYLDILTWTNVICLPSIFLKLGKN